MEPGFGQEKTDAMVQLASSNLSFWEKFQALEVSDSSNDLDMGMESEMKVDNPEKGPNAISCGTSCSQKNGLSKDRILALLAQFPDQKNLELLSGSAQTEEDVLVSGCQTPTGSIFDPFAAGPEELACAPKKKVVKESRIPLRRQLNFDSCVDPIDTARVNAVDDAMEEDHFRESVYQSVLEVVLFNHFEGISSGGLFAGINLLDSDRTPTSLPPLTGAAETCPDAPLRQGLKSRRLSPSICRKLQF